MEQLAKEISPLLEELIAEIEKEEGKKLTEAEREEIVIACIFNMVDKHITEDEQKAKEIKGEIVLALAK